MNCLAERRNGRLAFRDHFLVGFDAVPFPVLCDGSRLLRSAMVLRPTAGPRSPQPSYSRIGAADGSTGEAFLRINS